ncbi:hypothetical protein OIN60_01270 [Paenibacillus sp. P96]|uniref:Uncharacterized protein n=1 Tax=Paenibacillus zeirhizosphaerae TaxID=2987519 RepID=A0ABT9FL06_9BACL|nr:hypothetical protein [Paenibacillus sp. P96]MDP4095422.1 hypothetical protein [Paenibacillus sp. P96]
MQGEAGPSIRLPCSIFLGFHSFVKSLKMRDAPEKALGIPEYEDCRTSSFHSWRLVLIFIHLLAFYFFRPPLSPSCFAEKAHLSYFMKDMEKEMFSLQPNVYISYFLPIESKTRQSGYCNQSEGQKSKSKKSRFP